MITENYKPKRPVVIICVVTLLAFTIYVVKTVFEKQNAFAKGTRYTIGYTMEKYITTTGFSIKYSYKVDRLEYTETTSHAYNSIVPNGRYWVKFSIEKPSISEIYQDKPVSQNVKSAPPGGFDFMMK